MRIAKRILWLLMILALAGCDQGQEPVAQEGVGVEQPTRTEQENNAEGAPPLTTALPVEVDPGKLQGVFGFADETGSRLIVTGEVEGQRENLDQITHAVGENGVILSVTHEMWQEGDDAGSGRDTSYNFAHLSGDLFTVTEGIAEPNATYYLFQPQEIPLNSLLEVALDGQPVVDENLRERLESAKDRDIRQLWRLAEIGTDAELYLALFHPDGKEHLFSFVLVRNQSEVVLDYPATVEDTNSVWRVDDQGEVIPEMFSFLFAARTTGQGIFIAMEWYGAEGINVLFLRSSEDRFIELETRYGRYTAPL
ncbi:MAG: hypothetical protein E6Y08_13775 [Paenibacillus sp.]|uniref:hypothetical protein n=1 Tax=Paenibacillus sp. TaxID=58172 RepID=UPI00291188AB|nr:hypothetical protein [Paenibacillus sp.]MDU4696881.1 hypothetical protein [Paenibacillus sp.]